MKLRRESISLIQDSYLYMALLMAILSLWKTYSGPAIAALMSYGYPEMLLFNLVPALLFAYFGWALLPVVAGLRKRKTKALFRPQLRVFIRRWDQYGQVSIAVLAPVLVGIPSYKLISKQLKQNPFKTFGLLVLSLLGWSSLAYCCFLFLDPEQYAVIGNMVPESMIEKMAL